MMRPADSVLPGLEDAQTTWGGKDVLPLPALNLEDEHGTVLTRWELDDDDRRRIAEGGSVFLYVRTGGQPLQPVMLTTETPAVEGGE